MTDTNVGNPNDGNGGGSEPTPEQIKANRLALLDKFEVEAARQAQRTPDGGDSGGGGDDDDAAIDLTGLEPAVAASIRRKLKDADRRSRHVSTLAEFGLEQAQRAKALELAMEFNLDKDEIARVQKALGSARTPDSVDLAARELAIRLREDGSVTIVRYTSHLREEVLSSLLSSSQHHLGLVSALEDGVVPPGAIDSLRRKQLTESRDSIIRDRANKVYQSLGGADRAKVYDDLKTVVQLTSDPENGRQVFKRVCSSCHRLDREGTPVGPDLFGIRNQPKEAILLHILIPEREITQGYAAYVVATKDGRVLTGLLSAETPTSITLCQSLGKEDTILQEGMISPEWFIYLSIQFQIHRMKAISTPGSAYLLANWRRGGKGSKKCIWRISKQGNTFK